MTRYIPRWLAPVVEYLELDQPRLMNISGLESILAKTDIETPARVVASKLRDLGWLLETDYRGVWEFASGAQAGPYGTGDATLPLQAALVANPSLVAALTFQSAAWALGLADRLPSKLEVATDSKASARILARAVRVSVFTPNLPPVDRRNVPVLSPASVLVHLSAKPNDVRSWASAIEWLPDLAAEASAEELLRELEQRPRSVTIRLGYLLQGLRPDVGVALKAAVSHKVWFGPRRQLLRHDAKWEIADTLLPFDPADLPSVADANT